MATPSIFISYFSNKTLQENLASGEKKLFSKSSSSKIKNGDIIILVNGNTNEYVGVAVAQGILQPRHLLDPDIFSGVDKKYQKSELLLHSIRFFQKGISLKTVGKMCGIPDHIKSPNNINKKTPFEYTTVFYKGQDAENILSNFKDLVLTWI